jgi:hypothetical protein
MADVLVKYMRALITGATASATILALAKVKLQAVRNGTIWLNAALVIGGGTE